MKQVMQALRTGTVDVREVPSPNYSPRFVLVRNRFSAISAGTEKTKVDMGKKTLLGKAAARPDLVKQVLKKLKTDGYEKTFQTVRARLDSPSPLGYSSAGEVIAVGGEVRGLSVGDRVACGGVGYANHAEVVAVPRNLIARIPDGVSDEEAAFATLGSIALQGVRLAKPSLGESFLVVGLGLLGQITVQLLRANGCRVIGTDLNEDLCASARSYGAETTSSADAVRELCAFRTAGHGVDGVLICAGTSSNQPIELSGEVTRQKGRVVVVGAVRMDIPREPYFKKEISVVISRSYGPGRYDPNYEEAGEDYPYGYVRFTEQRNMESFLRLIADGSIDVRELISHRFTIDDAPSAFSLLEGKAREPYLGIVLEYPGTNASSDAGSLLNLRDRQTTKVGELGISMFGAGNYATATLLPVLTKLDGVRLVGLATASGRTAQDIGDRAGFGFCSDTLEDLLCADTSALIIATRHDTHASSTADALSAGKHVFVEKPLALSRDEFAMVSAALSARPGTQLMIGFNRRFAPLTLELGNHFAQVRSPLVINIRVNAGEIPPDHWIQDPKVGGGRLIGEGCHFIDLATAIAGSDPVGVHAIGTARADKSPITNDNVIVTMRFRSGSIAVVTYTADGARELPKEYVEVFGGGRAATISDFKTGTFYDGGKARTVKLSAVDKGQRTMLAAWVAGLRSGTPCAPIDQLMASSLATLLAVESLQVGGPVPVEV
jgi:predicted dehydrogenase/threonine dehydrogenase-like Zn-dependent dehydrogenase